MILLGINKIKGDVATTKIKTEQQNTEQSKFEDTLNSAIEQQGDMKTTFSDKNEGTFKANNLDAKDQKILTQSADIPDDVLKAMQRYIFMQVMQTNNFLCNYEYENAMELDDFKDSIQKIFNDAQIMKSLKSIEAANNPEPLQNLITELSNDELNNTINIKSNTEMFEIKDIIPTKREFVEMQNQFTPSINNDKTEVDLKALEINKDYKSNLILQNNQSVQLSDHNEIKTKEMPFISKINEIDIPMMKALSAGEKHIVVQIDPPELGSVTIRLVSDNGVLKANFVVDSSTTKDAFTTSMSVIKTNLENAGIKTGDFNIDVRDSMDKHYYSDGRRHNTNDDSHKQHSNRQKNTGHPNANTFTEQFA